MQTDEKPHDWDRSAVYCALGRKVNESMKKVIAPVLLLCLLTVTASAAYVPEEVVSENRDGRQLVVKTYVLSPEADPGELIEEPFELEGYTYHYLETIKEEQAFKDTRAQTEVVTVETETNDLADILRQLAPTMEYSKDGFSGTLTLEHTSLQTEAKGYTTKYYTITDTKQFPGLSRNDPSYVPATTVKNGSTLTLSDISWTVTGTGLADDILVPTSYTATATYTTTGSQKVATGFVTTASYTGEVTAAGIRSVVYTVTYLFVRNIYECRRMQYTLMNLAGTHPETSKDGKLLYGSRGTPYVRIQFGIPDEVEPQVFWPWRESEIERVFNSVPPGTYSLDAWDVYRDGIFLRTEYNIDAF